VRVASVDAGFVAAAPARVFEVLADPRGYARWWPGVASSESEEGAFELRLPSIGRVRARPDGVQPGVELTLRLTGRRCEGRLQWYLERHAEGTKVYGIVDLETERRWGTRRRLAVRAGVRRALIALRERERERLERERLP
jgi:uncharacterized protein YndB with AHSA1/START domain